MKQMQHKLQQNLNNNTVKTRN